MARYSKVSTRRNNCF